MIRIAITVQAYEAIVATLPIGSVGYAKRDRAHYGRRDADRNPSERVARRRGAGPGIDAPLEPAVFVSPPRGHPAPGRSAATPTSNANEGARRLRDAHRWLDELLVDPTQTIESLAIREGKSERSNVRY